jgi:hypothetical protein
MVNAFILVFETSFASVLCQVWHLCLWMWWVYGRKELVFSPCICSNNCTIIIQGVPGGKTVLQEGVPYVKLYQYNPKHLYPELNRYGDNGHRKVWASVESTYCTPSVMPYSSTAHAWQRDITVHSSQRKVALTSQDNISCGLHKVLGNLRQYDSSARVFVVQFNGFMSLTS